jgi:hypothetical protein
LVSESLGRELRKKRERGRDKEGDERCAMGDPSVPYQYRSDHLQI